MFEAAAESTLGCLALRRLLIKNQVNSPMTAKRNGIPKPRPKPNANATFGPLEVGVIALVEA